MGCGRALAAAVGVAFDDELVAGGGEPVDGGLGQERVGHEGQPFAGVAVGGDDGGGPAVAFGDDLVEVGGLGGVRGWRAKSSMMSSSTAARRRYSASRVLSRRAAVRRLNSLSARAMATVRRRRMAMWPRAVARCVFPTPVVIHGT